MKQFSLAIFILLFTSTISLAHRVGAEKADIGLNEKQGQILPAGLLFFDENGKPVDLKNRIDKPTIIAPIYFGCMHTCPMLLSGLAQTLSHMDMVKPGKDFQVMAVSFDEKDTPATALDKKRNYVTTAGKDFPSDSWNFLTGDATTIRRFTDAIGFKFQRDGEHDFSHPVTLVVLAPGGKIVRYIEGVSFLPFEVGMAVTEASEGRIGSPARKALMYCFTYDPLKKSYVFNILKVTGTVMVLFLAGFFAYLMMTSKAKRSDS